MDDDLAAEYGGLIDVGDFVNHRQATGRVLTDHGESWSIEVNGIKRLGFQPLTGKVALLEGYRRQIAPMCYAAILHQCRG